MFSLRSVCLSVCLSLCPSDNWITCERILTKFLGGVGHGPGTNEFNFAILVTIRITAQIQESVPDSEIRIHWIIEEIINGFWWNLRRAGVWPRDQLITFWCRSANSTPLYCQNPLLANSIMSLLLLTSIICKFQHVPFTAYFHYLQIQPPLLPKSITCNFSAPF